MGMGIYEEKLQNEVNGHEISYTFVIGILEVTINKRSCNG